MKRSSYNEPLKRANVTLSLLVLLADATESVAAMTAAKSK